MIENPYPEKWQDLQDGVCRILNEIGISSVTNYKCLTPRGEVEIDVFGTDEKSVEKIQYVIECKNWNTSIPQSVVHSFTTVMHETGGHIGFIISKLGLQSGAKQYLNHTNIYGMSFSDFQNRYLSTWWSKQFCPRISDSADKLLQYVEPINSRRDKFYNKLSDKDKLKFLELRQKYQSFAMCMALMNYEKIMPEQLLKGKEPFSPPLTIDIFKENLKKSLGPEFDYKSTYYRDLILEISKHSNSLTLQFNELFGGDIFA